MKKRAAALAVLTILAVNGLFGCNDSTPPEVEIIPPEDITTDVLNDEDVFGEDMVDATLPAGDDADGGDVAMDVTKLEAGNLYNGGVYYASYHNSYFFNYLFEDGEKKKGQAALYVKDTYGEIAPLGTVSISFEVPNYPKNVFFKDGIVYYSIPGGSGSGIYQIQADGTNNRIVVQTPSDMMITQVDFREGNIYYYLSCEADPSDSRVGLYIAKEDGTANEPAPVKITSFAFDKSGALYYTNGSDGKIIVSDTTFADKGTIDTKISGGIGRLQVYGNDIYFTTSDNSNLYRAKLNGSEVKCILENYKVYSFIVVEERVYFAGTDDETVKSNQLNAIDITGQNHSVLTIEKVDSVMSDGEWIYCYVMNGDEYADSYRIRTNGQDFESSAIVG